MNGDALGMVYIVRYVEADYKSIMKSITIVLLALLAVATLAKF